MALPETLEAVRAKCGSIEGLRRGTTVGMPMGDFPHTETPFVWISAETVNWGERETFGDDGDVRVEHLVVMHLVVAGEDVSGVDVVAVAASFVKRFGEAFFGDDTLGGACWDAKPVGTQDNFGTFAASDEYPEKQFRLLVTDYETVSG